MHRGQLRRGRCSRPRARHLWQPAGLEALKLLLDLPGQLGEELLVLDLLTMSISRVRAKRAAACPDHAKPALVQTQPHAQTHSRRQRKPKRQRKPRRTRKPRGPGQTPSHAPNAPAPLELDFDSLDDARAAGYDIVDIREPNEIAETPTPTTHARHIPMAQLLHGTPAFTPEGKTLLVCASGRRSLAATQELRSRRPNRVLLPPRRRQKLTQRVPATFTA